MLCVGVFRSIWIQLEYSNLRPSYVDCRVCTGCALTKHKRHFWIPYSVRLRQTCFISMANQYTMQIQIKLLVNCSSTRSFCTLSPLTAFRWIAKKKIKLIYGSISFIIIFPWRLCRGTMPSKPVRTEYKMRSNQWYANVLMFEQLCWKSIEWMSSWMWIGRWMWQPGNVQRLQMHIVMLTMRSWCPMCSSSKSSCRLRMPKGIFFVCA